MLKILIVDDEKSILELSETLMGIKDFDVTTCSSPEEAINVLKENSFDAILSDMVMPGMSGLEFYYKIEKLGIICRPFIIVTGHETREIRPFLSKGIDKLFFKPTDFPELSKYIKSYHREQNRNAAS